HAHQRLAERIAIGRIEVVAVVAVRHHGAGHADVHGGLVPFRGRRLPRLAPGRRAARHRAVADRQRGVEAGAHPGAADEPVTRLPSESLSTLVTQEWARSSKLGLRIAIGITVRCGEPFALASQPKRWQKPQYWQAPNFAPSGLV